MQSYIFPYIGYFQLIQSVDKFVFLDDVNFIKKGWINRNRLGGIENPFFFTIPCQKLSQNKLICETEIDWESPMIPKLFKAIDETYRKAPNFDDVRAIIQQVFSSRAKYISELSEQSVKIFCNYLGLERNFIESSSNENYNKSLKSSARIIDIIKKENCSQYHNAIGGIDLYSKDEFDSNGIELSFVKTKLKERNNGTNDYVSFNSIIDVAMNNSIESINEYLKEYELV